MLSMHLRLGLPSGSFPLAFLPITYTPSSSPLFVLHARLSHPHKWGLCLYFRKAQITLEITPSPISDVSCVTHSLRLTVYLILYQRINAPYMSAGSEPASRYEHSASDLCSYA
jgi:hypothetical protein